LERSIFAGCRGVFKLVLVVVCDVPDEEDVLAGLYRRLDGDSGKIFAGRDGAGCASGFFAASEDVTGATVSLTGPFQR
jgi:hypothetical protein